MIVSFQIFFEEIGNLVQWRNLYLSNEEDEFFEMKKWSFPSRYFWNIYSNVGETVNLIQFKIFHIYRKEWFDKVDKFCLFEYENEHSKCSLITYRLKKDQLNNEFLER